MPTLSTTLRLNGTQVSTVSEMVSPGGITQPFPTLPAALQWCSAAYQQPLNTGSHYNDVTMLANQTDQQSHDALEAQARLPTKAHDIIAAVTQCNTTKNNNSYA